eukprot:31336-Pelagococcus_subviridis.AAC.14
MNPCASTRTRRSTHSGCAVAKSIAAAPPNDAPTSVIGLPISCFQNACKCARFASGERSNAHVSARRSSSGNSRRYSRQLLSKPCRRTNGALPSPPSGAGAPTHDVMIARAPRPATSATGTCRHRFAIATAAGSSSAVTSGGKKLAKSSREEAAAAATRVEEVAGARLEATRARTPRADVGAVETTTRDDASDDIATDEQRRPLHYWIRARGETDRSIDRPTAERTARGGDGRRSRSVDGRGYVRERDASVGDLPEGRARCRLRARRRDDRGNSIVDCDACHLSFCLAVPKGTAPPRRFRRGLRARKLRRKGCPPSTPPAVVHPNNPLNIADIPPPLASFEPFSSAASTSGNIASNASTIFAKLGRDVGSRATHSCATAAIPGHALDAAAFNSGLSFPSATANAICTGV